MWLAANDEIKELNMRTLLAIATATLCLIAVGFAQSIQVPFQKEGLWSNHRETVNNPGNVKNESTEKICRSHAYDQYVRDLAKKVAGCKVVSESYAGGIYSIATECSTGGSVIKSNSTVKSLGEDDVRSESHATYTPPLFGMSNTSTTMEQKYLGSCPTGMQPGDITHENGTVTHTWKP